jgi:hypothetical protein
MTGQRNRRSQSPRRHSRREAFVGIVRTFLEGFVGLPTT